MKKIAVIGDLMLDQFDVCKLKRFCNEENTILDLEKTVVCIGGAGNVAANVKAISNDQVVLFGSIGNDIIGEKLLKLIKNFDIVTNNIIISQDHTTHKIRILNNDKVLCRVDRDCFADRNFENTFLTKSIQNLVSMDTIVFSDYDKGVVTESIVKEIVSKCCRSKIIVDTKKKDITCFSGVDTICVTLNEFNQIANKQFENLSAVKKYGFDFLEKYSIHNLIIKNNSEGSVIYNLKDYKVFYAHDYAEKKCAIGAGDVFLATYCVEITHNALLNDALLFANKTASKSVTQQFTSIAGKDSFIYD